MVKLKVGKPSGILNPSVGETKFQLSRRLPAQDLSYFMQRYWMVKWDLGDREPHLQETLPYPCVNLVFESDKSRIFGVITGKFSVLLENKGWVFGVKFRPGAFYPFMRSSVSTLTDASVCL